MKVKENKYSCRYFEKERILNEKDISKYLTSLRTRLGFARFKMNQGWESSNIFDVEQLWKKKQQKFINELPKPRFTQRDIIDKRLYIHSTNTKKSKLIRTLSTPSILSNSEDELVLNNTTGKKPFYFYHFNQSIPPSTKYINNSIFQLKNKNISNHKKNSIQPKVRNSLDYLSYAIAMTEEAEQITMSQPLPDISQIEPNINQEQVENLTIVDPPFSVLSSNSPPSSPVTLAAKTIMMLVNNNERTSQSTQCGKKPLYSK